MKIWLTSPRGAKCGGLLSKLLFRWNRACSSIGATYEIIEARSGEIHGTLLERLWISKILASDDPIHIISEVDFIPTRTGLLRISQDAPRLGLNFLAAPYVTRVYEPTEQPSREPGKIQMYSDGTNALVGPWFMYLDLRHPALRRLPDNWLGAAGPFNDAANLALTRGKDAGFLTDSPRNWGLLKMKDAFPAIHGVRLPKIGLHAFFSARLDDPLDSVVCWHSNPNSLTVLQHRDNLQHLLLPRK